MGVPGFFGWLMKVLKNFKKMGILKEDDLNVVFETLGDDKIVDEFYIDGNCLIHPVCFYTLAKYQDNPRVTDPNFLHNKMFRNIFKYIKYLVTYVKAKSVFLAIDGVAPLAKINQQRKRRFMSIQEARDIDNIKKKYGKYKPQIWNNTCISPGTDFMEDLHIYLLGELPKLGIKVTYSSYHTPSEGEHKILQEIRTSKLEMCRVIYGLDADLIFLALAANKNNIYLLREESQLDSKNKKNNGTESSMFELLNYVSIDDLKKVINFKIKTDISRKFGNDTNSEEILLNYDFVNDFIFICYLLGNDFLPHIPSIDIKINGMQLILNCYAETFFKYQTLLLILEPTIENATDSNSDKIIYINNIFFVDMIFLLSKYEKAHFTNFLPQYLEKLNAKMPNTSEPCELEIWHYNNVTNREDNFLGNGKKKEWKYNYYCKYFGIDGNQEEIIKKASHKYLEGIAWTTKYYFNKCPSWNYQYDYNYCPFLSDIVHYIKSNSINMNAFRFLNNPSGVQTHRLCPLPIMAQLISLIPPQRSELLPQAFRKLVTQESAIIDMYPESVTVDTMNKEQRFKCVPNLPYVDIDRILETIKNVELTKSEIVKGSCYNNFLM